MKWLPLLLFALPVHAATLTVTNTADSGPGSLRDTLAAAASGDTVTFGGAAFTGPENSVTIRLTSGPILIGTPVTIDAPANANGGNKVVVSGDADASNSLTAGDVQAFNINIPTAGTFAVNRLTFQRCRAAGGGGAVVFGMGNAADATFTHCRFLTNRSDGPGGAVFCAAASLDLVFDDCQFDGNSSLSDGGAIHASALASLRLISCDFLNNRANLTGGSTGGAVYAGSIASIEIDDCTFESNIASNNGGSLRLDQSAAEIRRCLFSYGSANQGSALFVFNAGTESLPVHVSHCTFTSNTSSQGAGAVRFTAATAGRMEHCTLTGNLTNVGGTEDGGAVSIRSDAAVEFKANLIAGNQDFRATGTKTPDVFVQSGGTATSTGGNVIGVAAGSGSTFGGSSDATGTITSPLAPGLLPLANNGGPTLTHALYPLSPARDFATGSTATTDQRGLPRPSGAARDAGAYELQLVSFATWAAERLAAFPESDRQENDDPDGDGFSNGIEFIQGTAPALSNSRFDRIETDANGTWYSFTVSNDADLSSLSATLEESPDLMTWTSRPLNPKSAGGILTQSNATRSRYRIAISTAGRPEYFFRMKVGPFQMNN